MLFRMNARLNVNHSGKSKHNNNKKKKKSAATEEEENEVLTHCSM